jgi:hypothetical protein
MQARCRNRLRVTVARPATRTRTWPSTTTCRASGGRSDEQGAGPPVTGAMNAPWPLGAWPEVSTRFVLCTRTASSRRLLSPSRSRAPEHRSGRDRRRPLGRAQSPDGAGGVPGGLCSRSRHSSGRTADSAARCPHADAQARRRCPVASSGWVADVRALRGRHQTAPRRAGCGRTPSIWAGLLAITSSRRMPLPSARRHPRSDEIAWIRPQVTGRGSS